VSSSIIHVIKIPIAFLHWVCRICLDSSSDLTLWRNTLASIKCNVCSIFQLNNPEFPTRSALRTFDLILDCAFVFSTILSALSETESTHRERNPESKILQPSPCKPCSAAGTYICHDVSESYSYYAQQSFDVKTTGISC